MLSKDTIDQIREERNSLERALQKARKELDRAPDELLQYRSSKKGGFFYYSMPRGTRKKTYLGKKKLNKAIAIAQRDYDILFTKIGNAYLEQLNSLLSFIEKNNIDDAYDGLIAARKTLVCPLLKTAAIKKQEFETAEYQGKSISGETVAFKTDRNEVVRSKSEVLIANKLNFRGIPYKYERPVEICGFIVHPDFSVWNASKNKVVYWEHFGMMDDPQYCKNAIQRINQYESAGYKLGSDIIYTFESSQNRLTPAIIEHMIDAYCV